MPYSYAYFLYLLPVSLPCLLLCPACFLALPFSLPCLLPCPTYRSTLFYKCTLHGYIASCNLLTDDDKDQNIIVRKRRPTVVITEHPENQDTFRKATKKRSYDSEQERNKIKIISDSIPKQFRMREFNLYLNTGNAHLKSFSRCDN